LVSENGYLTTERKLVFSPLRP